VFLRFTTLSLPQSSASSLIRSGPVDQSWLAAHDASLVGNDGAAAGRVHTLAAKGVGTFPTS